MYSRSRTALCLYCIMPVATVRFTIGRGIRAKLKNRVYATSNIDLNQLVGV